MSKYRIVIVDDHALIRRGLRNIIERHGDLAVAGEAADGEILLKRLSRGGVDMVLLDITLPGADCFAPHPLPFALIGHPAAAFPASTRA
jgi:DNA-binding NarL/FixJ family response regulator